MTADSLVEKLIELRRKYKAQIEEAVAKDARVKCLVEELRGLGAIDGYIRESGHADHVGRLMWAEIAPLIDEFMSLSR